MKPEERFTILQSVASDEVGEVFQTVKKDGQGLAAVKVFVPSALQDGAAAKAYEDAVRKIHEVGVARSPRPVALNLAEGNGWLATEWVGTDTLATFARRLDRFDGEVAAGIGCGILDALMEIHGASVAHGSLTPDKIWLSQGFLPGGVILGHVAQHLLFGNQPALQNGVPAAYVTSQNAAYLAPETIRDGISDARSDLYAVGAILYELLTGNPLYEGSVEDVLNAHVNAPVPKASAHPNVSQDISDILEIALDKDPEQRFQAAVAMRRALAHCRKSGDEASEQASAPLGMQPGQNIGELSVVNTLASEGTAEDAVAATAAAAQAAADEAAEASAAAEEATEASAAAEEAAEAKAAAEEAAKAKAAAEAEAAEEKAEKKSKKKGKSKKNKKAQKSKVAAVESSSAAAATAEPLDPATVERASVEWFALSKNEEEFRRLHGEETPPPLQEINRRYRRKSYLMIAAIIVLVLGGFLALHFFTTSATDKDAAESHNTLDVYDDQAT